MENHDFDSLTLEQQTILIEEEEKLFLQEQIELSVLMPKAPDLKELWNNAILQFGYIAFFSLSFPAAPFWGVIISTIHMNFTFYSMSKYIQRPICLERDSIGIWKHIFFVYSLIALAINAAILLFTSGGVFLLLEWNGFSMYDWYRVAVVIAIAENITFLLKYLLSTSISDSPGWIQREMQARKVRKTIDEERSKVEHHKIQAEIKEKRRSVSSSSQKRDSSNIGSDSKIAKKSTLFKTRLNEDEVEDALAQNNEDTFNDSRVGLQSNPLQHHTISQFGGNKKALN